MTEKTTKKVSVKEMLKALPPTVSSAIKKGTYLGATVANVPGAWTRVGPTWKTEIGWIVIGPGVRLWGTTQGLAELATANTANPSWHAPGIAIIPDPNLMFVVTPTALDSDPFKDVKEMVLELAAEVKGK